MPYLLELSCDWKELVTPLAQLMAWGAGHVHHLASHFAQFFSLVELCVCVFGVLLPWGSLWSAKESMRQQQGIYDHHVFGGGSSLLQVMASHWHYMLI